MTHVSDSDLRRVTNWSDLSLLSVPGKVFSHVLLERIASTTNDPTAATVRVYCRSLHYRCYPGSAIALGTSPTVQPSILNLQIQLTEMLSETLYLFIY